MVRIAAYLLCVLLALSFIFFEVLDVDGSDFKVAEPELSPDVTVCGVPGASVEIAPVVHRVAVAPADRRVDVTLDHASRVTLARALLPDPSA